MDRPRTDYIALLDYIDPGGLDYQDWLSVGMALHYEGLAASDWDMWSRRDAKRYHEGECYEKWAGFAGSPSPVTGGTIVHLARQGGLAGTAWQAGPDEWSPVLTRDPGPDGQYFLADLGSMGGLKPLAGPGQGYSPVSDMVRYLEALFLSDDVVNIVTQSYEKDGRHLPSSRGLYTKTAAEVIEGLLACDGDVGRVIGDYDEAAGAWVRINPMDGLGVKNENVSDYRYCLIESDTLPVDDQNRLIRALELPVAALVFSGGKSLHAVVRIDATDAREYSERVRAVMKACADNGLEVDNANKNPSRLSRLPGIRRGEGWQYIVDTGIGKATYEEWLAWRDEQADGLPDAVSFADEAGVAVADPDVLIEGVLAKGEKLLLAGPSKAGKSFALLQLCVAFAEGLDWLGLSCQQTDVLYVNLELKAESRKRRMQDIYRALGIEPINARRIHSMDLRGKLVDLDRLTAKLVRQAVSTDCKVVIIDPIYKVLHGDENSSEDVSRFCVALDYLVDRLGVSVIYCHHYSKGASAYASSMNRASGSSVFSRDADALVTLDEIELTEPMRQARFNTLGCALVAKAMDGLAAPGWRNSLKGPDDLLALDRLRADMVQILGHGTEAANNLIVELDRLEGACMETLSAWRVEGTLRDFPKLAPFEAWYDWPLHSVDDSGVLKDAVEDGAKAYRNGQKATVKETYEQKASRVLGNAYTLLTAQGVPPEKVTTGGLAEAAGCSKDTIVRYLDVVKTFERDPKTGVVTVITRKDEGAEKASLRGAAGGFE